MVSQEIFEGLSPLKNLLVIVPTGDPTMSTLPQSLDEAIAQARTATQAALDDGLTRLQVELAFSELKIMPLAEQFVQEFEPLGSAFRVFFSDAGAAALARRDWGEKPFPIRGIGELKAEIQPDEQLFLFIEPSSVEVNQVETLCNQATERPVVFLNPRLEDVATLGIGYAGRQLRDRFLNTLESCYHLRPLQGGALYRCYPGPWQVWIEQDGEYKLAVEQTQRPTGEQIDAIFMKASDQAPPEAPVMAPRRGFFSNLKGFLRALNQ